jgi:hypothetical protein
MKTLRISARASVFVFLFASAMLSASCSSKKSEDENGADSTPAECSEPENPYSEGTGHYAGYEWAERNGGNCSASSQSFNEGCEEYEEQETTYESCQGKR